MYFFTSFATAVLALPAFTLASAIPQPAHYREYVDTVKPILLSSLHRNHLTDPSQFDNVTATPALAITPAGFQNNINYTRFSVAVVGPLNGLKTPSPPNAAVLSVRNDLTTPNSNALNPTATATKSPAIKYFSLLSFFFGCVEASAESTANTAVGCDISVTGYNVEGNMVGEASFNYAPGALVQAAMAKAELPTGFAQVVSFTLGISTSTVGPAATALLFDNVTHVNYW